jgi:hypothetical protein
VEDKRQLAIAGLKPAFVSEKYLSLSQGFPLS